MKLAMCIVLLASLLAALAAATSITPYPTISGYAGTPCTTDTDCIDKICSPAHHVCTDSRCPWTCQRRHSSRKCKAQTFLKGCWCNGGKSQKRKFVCFAS